MKNITYKNVCQRLLYIDASGSPIKGDKKKFDTLDLAIEAAKRINALKKNIHKVVAYKCKTCHKYHIGKNKTIL